MAIKERTEKDIIKVLEQDYTQGGRVGYQKGNKVILDPETGQALQNQQVGQPDMIAEDLDQTGGQNEFNQSYGINVPGTSWI